MLILTSEQQAAVNELAQVRAEAAKLKRRADDLRTEILASLHIIDGGEGKVVQGAGPDTVVRGVDPDSGRVVLAVGCEERTKVNGKKLEALWPEVFAQVRETSTVTVVRTPT